MSVELCIKALIEVNNKGENEYKRGRLSSGYIHLVLLSTTALLYSTCFQAIGDTTNCAPTPLGLVSWWPGTGSATDIVGGNSGIFRGGSAFVAGEVGQAFAFDGVSTYVEIPDAPSLNPPTALTVESWIYLEGFPDIGVAVIAAKEVPYVGNAYQLAIANV